MKDSRVADIGKASGGSLLSKEINAAVILVENLQPKSSYPDGKIPELHREGTSFPKLVKKIHWEKSREITKQ